MIAPLPAFSPESRQLNLDRLREETFDVLVLGGGINGAGVARDLALRAARSGVALRVGLIEKHHFAAGASGKNSQLIHGGLRYLKYFEFRLVREALRERAILLQMAPHLVEPLPFLIPMYGWFPRLLYGTGLWLYDLLAGSRNIARHRVLPRDEVTRIEPGLAAEGLTSGAVFFDCRVNSARFVLENICDAARHGAVIANYTGMESYAAGPDKIFNVQVRAMLSGESFEVRTRKLVDATGPWEKENCLRLVRGSHIIVPRLNSSENAIAFFEETGRIVFIIPWGSFGQVSLIGTTDQDHADGPDDVHISDDERHYLLQAAHRLFPNAGEIRPIAAYSSLRPLIRNNSASPTSTSREHRIWNSEDGVLHIAGGKYTTYRAMSEEAADLVASEIAPELEGRCSTAETPIGGNNNARIDELSAATDDLASLHGLQPAEVKFLIREYGVQTLNLLESLPNESSEGLNRLHHARVAFAVRHEMAQQLADLLFVSTYWGYEQPNDAEALRPFAHAMGRLLNWTEEKESAQIQAVRQVLTAPAVFG